MESGTKNCEISDHRVIKLRKINEDDLEMVMHWRMLPEVTEYMYTDPQLDINQQKNWFQKIDNDKTCRYWIITVDDVAIGVVGITDIDLQNLRCNWNWYIGDVSYRGQGIAQQVQCNICDYVFEGLQLNRLYSEVLASNIRNIKAYEKCGYLIEGILKEHIRKNGSFHDVVVCAITKTKWHEIKRNYKYDKIIIED